MVGRSLDHQRSEEAVAGDGAVGDRTLTASAARVSRAAPVAGRPQAVHHRGEGRVGGVMNAGVAPKNFNWNRDTLNDRRQS